MGRTINLMTHNKIIYKKKFYIVTTHDSFTISLNRSNVEQFLDLKEL